MEENGSRLDATRDLDVVVVGAGFAGLYSLYKMRELGLSARVFEAGDGIGGTWFWNCYPGARCDVESLEYSFSFDHELEQEWEWTERYPAQPEILSYINHVADRFDLRRDIQLETRVISEIYDEATDRWTVETDDGARYSAKYVIMATGCLSAKTIPDFKGLDSFQGQWYHTGNWPKEKVDFKGKRVGFIGTGSTGIQAIPAIAEEAAHITVFQRTPNFSVPAQNRPLEPEVQAHMKANYAAHRAKARISAFGVPVETTEMSALDDSPEARKERYEARWAIGGGAPFLFAYADLMVNAEANETAAEFVREKIRSIVKDPKVAELLTPTDHPVGTKRICVDTGYYKTYNRDNISLVDVRSAPIEEITPTGLRTTDAEYEFDALVFATGFDAMTGALFNIDIRGRNGVRLKEKWADGPHTYVGLFTAGFPNFFMITGPLSPSVLTNMVVSIEQHTEWIADCIAYLRANDLDTIEATVEAEDAWVEHAVEVANMTLFPRAKSWYTGGNIEGKARLVYPYLGGLALYGEKLADIVAKGYDGLRLSGSEVKSAA
jgi:cyclohexanone monooxygenase